MQKWMIGVWLCCILTVVSSSEAPKFLGSSKVWVRDEGEDVMLVCDFQSTEKVTFAWLKEGAALVKTSRHVINTVNDKMQMLTIKNVLPDDGGVYTCIGTNSFGRGQGDIQLTVLENYKPIISLQEEIYVKERSEFKLTCEVDAKPVVASPTWSRLGYILEDSKEEGVLLISNMAAGDVGTYICTATNVKGTTTKQVQIRMATGLQWLEKPKDEDILLHKPLVWTARVVSPEDTTAQINWFKDGNIIDSSQYTQTVYGATYISTFVIDHVSTADAGRYQVTVDPVSVSAFTHNMNLTVWAEPMIEIDEGNEVLVKVGESLKLKCLVAAYPTPVITWSFKNGTNGKVPDGAVITQGKEGRRLVHTLTVSNIQEAHRGVYECKSNNSMGGNNQTVKVDVDTGEGTTASNKSTVIIVVVVCAVIIILTVIIVVLYMRYRERLFGHGHLAANGQFYADIVTEEKDISNLDEVENNPYSIKKNINISIKQDMRSGSMSTRKYNTESEKDNNKKFSMLKGMSLKRADTGTMGIDNHYARLDPVVCQGKSVDFKHIKFDEIIGTGEYGLVSSGRLDDGDDPTVSKDVSIKMLHDDASPEVRRDILAELRMMRRVSRHPNVVALVGWCITSDNVYVLEEYTPFGTLLGFLRTQRLLSQSTDHLEVLPEEDRVDEQTLLSFAWQIASAMKHLASLQVVHRDLACRNAYLGHEKVCKVSEYGLRRDIYADNVFRKVTGGQLPVRWMSHEAVFQGNYTEKSDVWSFGILMWELVTLGRIPYPGLVRTEQLLDELENGYHMENPGHISTDLYLIMNSCWNRKPESRPTFATLCDQLKDLMNNENETHIDLHGLMNGEMEDALQREDDCLSPTTDFHRPPFKGVIVEVDETDSQSDANVVST